MNGVVINNVDIIFGDSDGVCDFPREIEEEVFNEALEKVRGEKLLKNALEERMSAVNAF